MVKNQKAQNRNTGKEWQREGPAPLHLHMNMAMSRCASGEITEQNLQKLIAGIQKYQKHSFRRQMARFEPVWNKNAVFLYHCPVAQNTEKEASVFIVPSLINKSCIFDLLPQKSFVRWLAQNGIESFLLDWGDLQNESGLSSMQDVFDEYIIPAIGCAHSKAGNDLSGLGYCMGGTLLAATMSVRPELLSGGVLLASPWDFHQGNQPLTNRIKAMKAGAAQMMLLRHKLPVETIQGVFASLDPDQMIRKFSRFLEMEEGSDEEQIFIAVEDWLNDGQDIPKGIAQCLIEDWYDKNLLQKGQWRLGDRYILPENIDVPVLIVASGRDRLVPRQSSTALAEHIAKTAILEPDCGHIGIMAGHDAEKQVWEPVCDWIKKIA